MKAIIVPPKGGEENEIPVEVEALPDPGQAIARRRAEEGDGTTTLKRAKVERVEWELAEKERATGGIKTRTEPPPPSFELTPRIYTKEPTGT